MQKNQYVHAEEVTLPIERGGEISVKAFPLAGLPALGDMDFWPAEGGKSHCLWGDGLHKPEANPRWETGFFQCANGWAAMLMRGDALAGITFHADKGKMEESWESLLCGLPVQRVADEGAKLKPVFAGVLQGKIPPLYLYGTPFQVKVWLTLAFVPRGELSTYGDIAAAIGSPKAGRAVGSSGMNKNRHLWVLPCHRVIGANGAFGGFGLGLDMKADMLRLEVK